MKSIIFSLLTFVLALYAIPGFAQYNNDYNVYADDNTYITTNPNIDLYILPSDVLVYTRTIIDVSKLKKKTIKKPLLLRVVKYTNISEQQEFNAYIVEYKNKLHVLDSANVQDNSHLRDKNLDISKYVALLKSRKLTTDLQLENLNFRLSSLKSQVDGLKSQLDSLVTIYRIQYTDSLNYYKNLKESLPFIKDSLIALKQSQDLAIRDKMYNEWYNTLPASTKKAANHISIISQGLGSPNSFGGCNYSIYYWNKSKKTIKYLHWAGTVYNRVNDPVSCQIRKSTTCKGKETGPIAASEIGGGTWENVIYEQTSDTLKLSSINIIYMDGSSINIAATDIRRLMKEPYMLVYSDTEDIENQISQMEVEYNRNINTLQRKLVNLQSKKYKHLESVNSAINSLCKKYHKVSMQYESISNNIIEIKSESERIQKEITTLDEFLNYFEYR